MNLKALLSRFWKTVSSPPATISLGMITIVGFVTGIIFWGGFNTALEYTNTEEFCLSCHEMRDNNYVEVASTVHNSNRTGVRATCPDCHVPHEWTHKIARKMQASKEVWASIWGRIDTREKFEERRAALAQHEWARLEANNSLECRNCHDYDSMDWKAMSPEARFYMEPAAELNTGCIECHKGIAHHLPENIELGSPAMAKLERKASSGNLTAGEDYFAITEIPVYETAEATEAVGHIQLGAQVQVMASQGDRVQFELTAWRKDKGYGRVLFDEFGQNIRVGVLARETAGNEQLVQASAPETDDRTGLDWRQVTASLWADANGFVPEIDDLWVVAEETYAASCSTCHAQPDPGHFGTNAWPAQFNGMVGFTNMDADAQTLVLTYLQKHSADYADGTH